MSDRVAFQASEMSPSVAAAAAVRQEIFREHFDFAQNIIERYVEPNGRRRALEERLKTIRKRHDDPILYLGVFGEFSAGKSTFINGLLRQDLLKAALKATTATITRIRHGNEFKLCVVFGNGKEVIATERDYRSLKVELGRLGQQTLADAQLRDLLHALTTSNQIASKVRRLDLELPAAGLGEYLTIIDTPGISPGDSEAVHHARVTAQAMDEADAALILIPATSPMSATLINFLESQAKPFLHRSMFVVTLMDQLNEDDRKEAHGYVRKILTETFRLKSPILYQSAAPVMIPGRAERLSSLADTAPYWQERFQKMEREMLDQLHRQRQQMISEKLVRLFSDLIQDLNQDVNEKRQKLEAQQTVLAQNSVEAIDGVVGRLYEECVQAVGEQRITLTSKSTGLRSVANRHAIQKSATAIREAGWTVVNYDEKIAPTVRAIVQSMSEAYIADVNAGLGELRETCARMQVRFAQQFERNYKAFPSLKVSVRVPPICVSSISVPKLSFAASSRYTESQSKEDKQGAGIGAVVGGIIGTLFFPGVGTAIGAALGGGGGMMAAGDSLDDRQKKLTGYAEEDISKYFYELESSIQRSIKSVVSQVLLQFSRAANDHVVQYGGAVEQLIAQHKTETRKLSGELQQTQTDSNELERQRQKLAKLQLRFEAA